ncbi:methionine--tRNA ligase [Ornithinibacillus contaminans]|uniref:methionine--tRNA ligase n=1 Tax=Ornithinibacillus contaminans TaxID=694055 RepID=UPI00064DBEDB|nr:methionine--tRNA ligase [Ornithinibacillus contaminans]
MSIFIGGAWPYANGPLHLGHLSSLLPGDVLARYYRLKGEEVLYVSGSDCNGTPIAIKAKQEGVTPKEIADRYHAEFQECFEKLGFTYDCYTRTDTVLHHEVVQDVFMQLLERGILYKKTEDQCYCEDCNQFLPDRYVEGTCPYCGEQARGDQCDYCSTLLNPVALLDKTCKTCGNTPIIRDTEHFYFELSSLQHELEEYLTEAKANKRWRENAIQLTSRYLSEGLQDRPVSRDLPNGVPVPVSGYEDKKIYVWIEAVTGYYTASKQWATINKTDESIFWQEDTTAYYVHGKDNIPFHTIIWPAILKNIDKVPLPTHIVSNEFLTIEQKKLSTSRNWAVWVPDILKHYHPDSIRYFLTINAPENRDADFSWREFVYSHNSELLGAYGNFVNRTLKFIEKFNDGIIPTGELDLRVQARIVSLYDEVGSLIERTQFKKALEAIFNIIRVSNKYFDEQKPWVQLKENPKKCTNTLTTCVYIIANLAQLLHPFLPFSSEAIQKMLRVKELAWQETKIESIEIKNVEALFERIDIDRIAIETKRLLDKSR